MSDAVFQKVIDSVKKSKITVGLFIMQHSGEPLADKNIASRIAMIKKGFPHSKIRLATNLSLLSRETAEQLLKSGLDKITISLNTLSPEKYRTITGGLDYLQTMENINTLLELNKKLNSNVAIFISVIQNNDNIGEIPAIREFWKDRCDIRVIQHGHWIGKHLHEKTRYGSQKSFCSALYKSITILSNGDYALCCCDAEGIVKKNIMTTPIEQCYFSGVYKEIRKLHRKRGLINKECADCILTERELE